MEDQFFRPRWYSVFFNPYFISRYPLYKGIQRFAKSCREQEQILDVGCGLKPYRRLFSTLNYLGIDIAGGGHADAAKCVDKYYDGKHIPYRDESFDVVICTQVLEHSEEPETVLQEIFRVLKTGGRLYLTVPLVANEHEIPYDFSRFTQYRLRQLCAALPAGEVHIAPTTKVFGVCGQLLSAYLFESIPFRSTLVKASFSLIILAPLQLLALLLDFLIPEGWVTLDYMLLACKQKV